MDELDNGFMMFCIGINPYQSIGFLPIPILKISCLNLTMNKFDQSEKRAAELVLLDAQRHANSYALPEDREAATIALLIRALELAGRGFLIKPLDSE
jgi:hypothetical protein